MKYILCFYFELKKYIIDIEKYKHVKYLMTKLNLCFLVETYLSHIPKI